MGRYKYATYGSEQLGSCFIRNAEYRYYEDGSTSWSAEVMSRKPNHRWLVSLTLLSDTNTVEFDGGSWEYDIRGAGQWKRWVARHRPNATIAQRWAQATRVRRKARC